MIEEIKRFGLGQVFESEYSPDENLIAYGTSFGVYVFDVVKSEMMNFIPSSGEVKSVNFSSDGEWLAYGNTQGEVIVWGVKNNEHIANLSEHETTVDIVIFSPDQQFLISSDESGRLNIFQTSDWSLERTHELRFVYAMEFLPDGSKLLVSVHNKGIVTLDSQGWGILNQYSTVKINGRNHLLTAEGIAISPDGKFMAVAMERVVAIPVIELSSGETYMLIRVDPNQTDFEKDSVPGSSFGANIYAVSISKDGKYLAFTGTDRTGLVDLENEGELTKFIDKGGNISKITFSPKGDRLVFGGVEMDLTNWEFEYPIYSPSLTNDFLESVNPNDGRKYLKDEALFASRNWELEIDQEKGTIALKETGASEPLFTSDAHTPVPFSAFGQTAYMAKITAAAANDDSFFVTGGAVNLLKLWTITENPEPLLLGTLKNGAEEIAISPDSNLIAVRDVEGGLYVFQSTVESSPLNLGTFNVANKIVFSPDSKLLAATVDNEHIIVWNLSGDTPVVLFESDQSKRFDNRSFTIDELIFSPDGKVLVSGGLGAQIDIWHTADGELLKVLDNRTWITRMQFSEDGTILYIDGQTDVRWWGVKQ